MSATLAPRMTHATATSSLADILERVLDKGIVIAGEIKLKIVDIELLTVQVRLIIASVERAREMGMDWWLANPDFCSTARRRRRPSKRRVAAAPATA